MGLPPTGLPEGFIVFLLLFLYQGPKRMGCGVAGFVWCGAEHSLGNAGVGGEEAESWGLELGSQEKCLEMRKRNEVWGSAHPDHLDSGGVWGRGLWARCDRGGWMHQASQGDLQCRGKRCPLLSQAVRSRGWS